MEVKINGKRLVLEAPKGITFRVQVGEEIVITAISSSSDISSNEEVFLNDENKNLKEEEYNYQKPFIPDGYKHILGTWDTGFVIQNQLDLSEFVWIPVGYLDSDGTLDGESFFEKFGKRNFLGEQLYKNWFQEDANPEMIESVKRNGGFYISRYHATKVNGKPVFRKGGMPWTEITYYQAEYAAEEYSKENKSVKSCITSGVAFSTILSWVIKSGAKTLDEVVKDSSQWGNYYESGFRKILKTGFSESWCVLNIYDLAGNVFEWSTQKYGERDRIVQGGAFDESGKYFVANSGAIRDPRMSCGWRNVSFRIMLYAPV